MPRGLALVHDGRLCQRAPLLRPLASKTESSPELPPPALPSNVGGTPVCLDRERRKLPPDNVQSAPDEKSASMRLDTGCGGGWQLHV